MARKRGQKRLPSNPRFHEKKNLLKCSLLCPPCPPRPPYYYYQLCWPNCTNHSHVSCLGLETCGTTEDRGTRFAVIIAGSMVAYLERHGSGIQQEFNLGIPPFEMCVIVLLHTDSSHTLPMTLSTIDVGGHMLARQAEDSVNK